MNLLGADYTNALAENAASRVNGLYNDANVTACSFSLSLFVALYLLRKSACVWRRLAASVLAGVHVVSLLLTGSRGALLCFAAACIVWLIAERADRVGLFLLLAETAVTMITAGVPASSLAGHGREAAVLVCLLGGVLLFALDALAGRRLGTLLSAHKRAALAAVGALCAVTAALCAAVFLHTGPYTFEEDDSYIVYVLPDGIVGRRASPAMWTATLGSRFIPNPGWKRFTAPEQCCMTVRFLSAPLLCRKIAAIFMPPSPDRRGRRCGAWRSAAGRKSL